MSSSSHPTAFPDPRAAIRRVINLGRDDRVVRTVYYTLPFSWSSHPTALPDPRAAIPRAILRTRYLKVVIKVCVVRDLDELDWRLDRLLDCFVPMLVPLVDGDLEDTAGNAMKKSMVRCVRRNPEIAMKILHGLSGNRIVKDVKGDYHFKITMSDFEYSFYKYAVNILTEGLQLFYNEDPKATMYNLQLWEDQVAKVNIRLLSNSPDTKNMDAINYRYMLDCAEAELAVATRLIRRGASRGDASRAFRNHLRTYQNDKARFKALRRMLQGTNISISDDLLRRMTSSNPNGIMIGIRNNGNRAAHCDSKQEGELQASIGRQLNQLQPCMEELRVVGLNYR